MTLHDSDPSLRIVGVFPGRGKCIIRTITPNLDPTTGAEASIIDSWCGQETSDSNPDWTNFAWSSSCQACLIVYKLSLGLHAIIYTDKFEVEFDVLGSSKP
jgi:hypothetical protein